MVIKMPLLWPCEIFRKYLFPGSLAWTKEVRTTDFHFDVGNTDSLMHQWRPTKAGVINKNSSRDRFIFRVEIAGVRPLSFPPSSFELICLSLLSIVINKLYLSSCTLGMVDYFFLSINLMLGTWLGAPGGYQKLKIYFNSTAHPTYADFLTI